MSLTKLESVAIENLTASKRARAVRLFPDGTFDGYAPLDEGENLLRITVKGEKGGVHTIDRKVLFTKTRARRVFKSPRISPIYSSGTLTVTS